MAAIDDYLSGLTCSDEGVEWDRVVSDALTVQFRVREIRREATGLHAWVGIGTGGSRRGLLDYSEFNLKRSEDRGRLGRSAHKQMSEIERAVYSVEDILADINVVCLWVLAEYEQRWISFSTFQPNGTPPPALKWLVYGLVLEDSGTILFAPPGRGKSYILQTAAVCASLGLKTPWRSEKRPAVYVSLERPARTLEIREHWIRRALGVTGASGIMYLHARGRSFRQVHRKLRGFVREHPGAIMFLDSITRVGLGKMVDDGPATQFIDLMQSLECPWMAIGHTPKADPDTLFGSQAYEAGEDLGIRLTSETLGNTLGVLLETVKANDVARMKPSYLALDFAEEPGGHSHLEAIRTTGDKEFPGLALSGRDKLAVLLQTVQRMEQPATIKAVAEAAHIPNATVARYLGNPKFFVKVPGRYPYEYRVAAPPVSHGFPPVSHG